MNRDVEKYIPLTESTYYILISFIKPLHGYGIMQNVQEISNERVKLGPGTLYGALKKLYKEGLITETNHSEGRSDRRKYYILTEFGKLVTKYEFKRLSDLVQCSERIVKEI